MAGGNNSRQRKSSSFKFVFNIFKSNKHRGGGCGDAHDEGQKAWTRVWTSDEDRGRWGVADPVIDMRATTFIAQYKKRFSESEIHCQPQPQQ